MLSYFFLLSLFVLTTLPIKTQTLSHKSSSPSPSLHLQKAKPCSHFQRNLLSSQNHDKHLETEVQESGLETLEDFASRYRMMQSQASSGSSSNSQSGNGNNASDNDESDESTETQDTIDDSFDTDDDDDDDDTVDTVDTPDDPDDSADDDDDNEESIVIVSPGSGANNQNGGSTVEPDRDDMIGGNNQGPSQNQTNTTTGGSNNQQQPPVIDEEGPAEEGFIEEEPIPVVTEDEPDVEENSDEPEDTEKLEEAEENSDIEESDSNVEVIPIEENVESNVDVEEPEEAVEENLEEEDQTPIVGVPLTEEASDDEDIEDTADGDSDGEDSIEATGADSDEEDTIAVEENSDDEDSDLIIGGPIPIGNEASEEASHNEDPEENSAEEIPEEEENLPPPVEETIPIEEVPEETENTLPPVEETIPIEEVPPILQVPAEYDCLNSKNYHFPNSTCGSTCPSGTYIIGSNTTSNTRTCTPCSLSCKTCQNSTTTCTSCPSNLPYLYPKNSTCLASCPSNTTVQENNNGQKICNITQNTLPIRGQTFVNFVDNSNQVTGTISSVTMVSYQFLNPGASAIPSIILMVNLLDYIKYINITFPPKLDQMFDSQLSDFLSFQIPFPFPESLIDEVHEKNVSARFQRYGVNGLFLVNMWGELLTALIVIVVAVLIGWISAKIHSEKWFGKLLFWLQDFLVWNYVLVYWLSLLNGIVLFAIVEYSNLYINGALAVISLIFNIALLTGSLFFLGFVYYKLRKLRIHNYSTFEDKVSSNSRIKVLFEDFKSFYFTQELMILISSAKVAKVIIYAFIVAAFDAPVAQSVLLVLLDLLMILYLVIFRPLKETLQNIELTVYEILIFIANCACLKLALQSPEEQEADITTGDAIIITNFILISAVLFFQVLSRGLQIREYVKNRKIEKKVNQQIHPCSLPPGPAPAPSSEVLTTANSTPKRGEELGKGDIETPPRKNEDLLPMTHLQLRLRMDYIQRRRSIRSASTIVSLSDNTRTIYIRSSSNRSEEISEEQEEKNKQDK